MEGLIAILEICMIPANNLILLI